MTLTQLSYILALDTYRNFRIAAEKCYVTQPTLSMQIQKLEEELGIQIFNRTNSPVVPTDIGNLIIEQARKVPEESDRIKTIIDSHREQVYGRLRIGIIPTVGPYLLPRFLKHFIANYPKVDLVINELQTEEIMQQLARNNLDTGIVASPVNHPPLIEKRLYYEPFVVYVSKRHRLYDRDTLTSKELSLTDL